MLSSQIIYHILPRDIEILYITEREDLKTWNKLHDFHNIMFITRDIKISVIFNFEEYINHIKKQESLLFLLHYWGKMFIWKFAIKAVI